MSSGSFSSSPLTDRMGCVLSTGRAAPSSALMVPLLLHPDPGHHTLSHELPSTTGLPLNECQEAAKSYLRGLWSHFTGHIHFTDEETEGRGDSGCLRSGFPLLDEGSLRHGVPHVRFRASRNNSRNWGSCMLRLLSALGACLLTGYLRYWFYLRGRYNIWVICIKITT